MLPYSFQLKTSRMAGAGAALLDQETEATVEVGRAVGLRKSVSRSLESCHSPALRIQTVTCARTHFYLVEPQFGCLSQQLNKGPSNRNDIAKP